MPFAKGDSVALCRLAGFRRHSLPPGLPGRNQAWPTDRPARLRPVPTRVPNVTQFHRVRDRHLCHGRRIASPIGSVRSKSGRPAFKMEWAPASTKPRHSSCRDQRDEAAFQHHARRTGKRVSNGGCMRMDLDRPYCIFRLASRSRLTRRKTDVTTLGSERQTGH